MMNCSNCGQKIPEGSRFCEYCGALLTVTPPKKEEVYQPANQLNNTGAKMNGRGIHKEEIPIIQTNVKKPAKSWIWIIVIALIVLGCCCVFVIGGLMVMRSQGQSWRDVIPGGIEELPGISGISTNTPLPEETVEPVLQEEPAELGNENPLNTILVITSSGIWEVNEQTREASQISNDFLNAPWDLYEGISADKNFFAYITGFGGASDNPMLIVLDIKNQTSILQLELTGPSIQMDMGDSVGDPGFEAFRAIEFTGSVAWSPDGNRLAFIAARDGTSADVYLFDKNDNSISRLTEEAGHAFDLHWSPDGQRLEYLSANSFGTGAGSDMEGLWVYDFKNQQIQLLETLDSSGETFLTWADNQNFLISSWSSMCENYNLRLVNAESFYSQVIVDGCFSGIDYDPNKKHGLFAVTEFNTEFCNCGQSLEAGLMVFGEGVGYPIAGEFGYKKFELLNAYTVRFIPGGNLFLVFGEDGQQFIYNDQLALLDIPTEVVGSFPYVSPNGEYWAWSSNGQNGLWITDRDMNAVELSPLFSGTPLWSQDGETIYFYENNRLFSAHAPQFESSMLIVEIGIDEILGLVR